VSEFVAHVLSLQIENSRSAMAFCPEFPIVMSRDFATAQELLKRRQRGSRRIGLIASSGGRRRAHGLEVRPELDVEDWFLNATSGVRSSYYLETPATEFGLNDHLKTGQRTTPSTQVVLPCHRAFRQAA
jgi:hypothetical protein